MPKYSVIVTRDTTESTVVEIHAEDEDDAEAKAVAFTHDNPHLEWEQDFTPNASKEHYTNGAELIEEEPELITDEDRLSLIEDLNEDGEVEGHDDYQSMIRRAGQVLTYTDAAELRKEYGLE